MRTRLMISTMCVAILVMYRIAEAGFRCGLNGKPKQQGAIGCDCPPDKQSTREGSDWVCATTLPVLKAPELVSPKSGALGSEDSVKFVISLPFSADELEVDVCHDRACRNRLASQKVAATT